jgi:hypothetical protein
LQSIVGLRINVFHLMTSALPEAKENAPVVDLQKLLSGRPATVTDTEILATARLNAWVKAFTDRVLSDDILMQITEVIANEADQLIADGVLPDRPD